MMIINYKLSFMMFLQFFIWGAWFVTLGTFMGHNLHSSGAQIGMAFSTQSWGAILAPFLVGLIADRYFNAEKILALLHLAGAALLFLMSRTTDFSAFYPYVLLYMILYMPTLALVNTVAFRQINDPSTEFARIRVWGTIGWIVAGLMISYLFAFDEPANIAAGKLRGTFILAAAAAGILGVYSFFLPSTPPNRNPEEKVSLAHLMGSEAFSLLKDRNFLVFFVASILICIPLAFYYQNTNLFLTDIGVTNPTGKMTLGQLSEVAFMLLLPVFLNRFGIKLTLLVGMLAWVARYVLFAFGDAGELMAMLFVGILLHGVCYDFFFVSGQVYTDAKAESHYRASAQGMITLATYGLGMLIGFSVAGYITDYFTASGQRDWDNIWLFPAVFALVVVGLFSVLFKTDTKAQMEVSEVK